jgi:hypothetical protein
MIARPLFRFHPSCLHAPSSPRSKSFISPAYDHLTSNSFVSPTYAKTGGCIPLKMSARRHFLSLFSQSPFSALLLFNHLRTLSFSVSHLSAVLPVSSALLPQKRGGIPPRSYQSHGFPIEVRSCLFAVNCRLSTVDCWLPARVTQHGSRSFFTGRWSPATSSPILQPR